MKRTSSLAIGFLLAVLAASGASAQTRDYDRYREGRTQLAQEVRDAIVRLPRYGVFDTITFEMRGHDVVLGGFVYNPTLKREARDEVREIAGVERVIDRIQILPTSQNDDRLRRSVFRALYSDGALAHYGTPTLGGPRGLYGRGRGVWASTFPGMQPLGNYAVHIVVSRGRVALFGVVRSEADRTRAEFAARGVLGVFGVENNIQVARG